MTSVAPTSTRWLTITQCVELIRQQDPNGRGISRRQLRRRLRHWDQLAGGRLLRWRSAPGGIREVNASVLLQVLRADPVQRELEMAEVQEKIDVIRDNVYALRAKQRKHGSRIDSCEKRLDAQKRAISALEECSKALAES